MNKCFDLCQSKRHVMPRYHHNTIVDGVFIRNLCLLRENNIVVDDQKMFKGLLIKYD